MAVPNILGDITSAMIGNYLSLVAGTGADSAASQRMLGRMIEQGGDELKGVSDPLEKIFNRLTYHIEEHGMTADMQTKYESLGRHLSITPDAPKILSDAHAAYSMGETLRTTPTPSVLSKPVSTSAPESRLRGSGLGSPAPTSAPAPATVNKELYYGADFGSDLRLGNIDPLKHSSSRTPLPAFTMSQREVAERYARTGGPGANRVFSGPLYKMGVQFDSPERIVGAFDQAGDEFVDFMRMSLPEQSTRAPLIPGGKPGVAKPREIFDNMISDLSSRGDRTNYAVMNAISDIHETYRPLGDYDYLPRGQGSIEARRFGIDALTWNDHGDNVIALLDPDDLRSNVGRKNITSVAEVDYMTDSAPTPVTTSPSSDELKKLIGAPETPAEPAVVTSKQQEFLDAMKAEKASSEQAARDAIPATRKSIEENGYLYHYAPREARESILENGLMPSKARTAVGDVAGEFSDFSKHVPENSMYFFTNPNDAPSAGTIFGTGEGSQLPDLYRVKIEPGMLDDMMVDPRVPIRGEVGSAVIVPSKTGSFSAELIGENARFGVKGDGISPATYDPMSSSPAPTSTADDLIEPKIVKAIENPTAEEYATARARGDLIATEAYDHGAEVAKSTASGDVLSEPPPPKPTKKGPGDIGKPADVRTRPSTRGADAASTTTGSTPKPPTATGSVAMDPPKVPTTSPSSGAPSKMRGLMDDGLEAAKNVAARNPMGIRAAAVAGLLGVGAVVAGRRGQPRSDQRNTYLEESRRKMQG